MPAQDGIGFHDEHRVAPGTGDGAGSDEHRPVNWADLGVLYLPA